MAIQLSTLRTNIWDTIYSFLKTGTYSITNSTKIHSSFNDKLIKDEGYPLVIIEAPITKVSKDGRMGVTLVRKAEFTISISCYDKSQALSKSDADNIQNMITTGMATLSGLGIKNVEFDDDDQDQFTENNKKIHIYTLNFSARYDGS